MKKLISATLLLLTIIFPAAAQDGRGVEKRPPAQTPVTLDLRSFGAVGDGVTDDGPALQRALAALADAGGGTLNVPAGRYAIATPVERNFSGATSIRILGVPSETPVNPWGSGEQITAGLDLVSEFVIRTGNSANAITLHGLESFLVSDVVFIGTPGASADARITLALYGVEDAVVRHCEFYGLISHGPGGGTILHADNSRLTIDRTAFLGSAADSSVNMPVVLNTTWKGFTIADSVFADYGQRPDYWGKLGQGAPYAWVTLGNPAPTAPLSPRREAVFRNVFMDEGAIFSFISIPDHYDPHSPSPDLVYVSGLRVNVSSVYGVGVSIYRARRVLIERAVFGLSTRAIASVDLWNAGDVILDRLECGAAADRIRADAATRSLTVIDSAYSHLDSQAQTTRVVTTASPEEDPVRGVRTQFLAALGREPDPAAHFYWPDRLLRCADDAACAAGVSLALSSYLAAQPPPTFSLSGVVADEGGAGLSGVTLSLDGSQQVSTATGAGGAYLFSGLPTSGDYALAPSRTHYTFGPAALAPNTPTGDLSADFAAVIKRHHISGLISTPSGSGLAGATVALSGSQNATATTDANGGYSFDALPAGGAYTVTAAKDGYQFSPAQRTFDDLGSNQTAGFAATPTRFRISGRVYGANNYSVQGAVVALSGSRAATTTTDAGGAFTFADLPAGGAYTVTPSVAYHTLSPSSRTYSALSADQYAEFSAAPSFHRIGGRLTGDGGQGLAGVTVALSGSRTATATTDAGGSYAFADLPDGGNYVVTPARLNYSFTPQSRAVSALAFDQTADFAGALNSYTISGRATENGSGLAGVEVTLSGSQSAAATTDAAGNYSFTVAAEGDYTVNASKTYYTFTPPLQRFARLSGNAAADFSAGRNRTIQFASGSYTVGENAGRIQIGVTRCGDASAAAEVSFSASGGTAREGSDLSAVVGALRFAPGEASQSFDVFVIDDAHVEGPETITLALSQPADGHALGSPAALTITIDDDDDTDTSADNPIDDARFFVQQHYVDFFGRAPDTPGLDFWTNEIASCGADLACVERKRQNVSAAFFLSPEFQQTGYYVHRLYTAAFKRAPRRVEEFIPGRQQVGRGVVGGEAGWEQRLEQNKSDYARAFVASAAFAASYPATLKPAQLVEALNANTGNSLTQGERDAALAEFGASATSADADARARALRHVAESRAFNTHEFTRAFVLMQYFGYLQRDPDDSGLNFWLGKLDDHGGDYIASEMVKSFLVSVEYRGRFGR